MQLPSLGTFAIRGAMLGPGEVLHAHRVPDEEEVVEMVGPGLAGCRGTVLSRSAGDVTAGLVAVQLHEPPPRRTLRAEPHQMTTLTTSGGCSLLYRQWPLPAGVARAAPPPAMEYNSVHAALSIGRLGKLDLHCNYLGSVVAVQLLTALENCAHLTELNLAFNQLDGTCGETLREWLPKTRLQVLDLWGNMLGKAGCHAVVDGLRLNQTLTTLSLGCNGLSADEADGVKATFTRLRSGSERATLKL